MKIFTLSKSKTSLQLKRLFLLVTPLFFIPYITRAQDVLLGLTSQGGSQGGSTAFSINSTGSGFAVKKAFVKLGISPRGNLVLAKDDNFYGMTTDGGAYKAGTIFKMTPAGAVTIIHHFNT